MPLQMSWKWKRRLLRSIRRLGHFRPFRLPVTHDPLLSIDPSIIHVVINPFFTRLHARSIATCRARTERETQETLGKLIFLVVSTDAFEFREGKIFLYSSVSLIDLTIVISYRKKWKIKNSETEIGFVFDLFSPR